MWLWWLLLLSYSCTLLMPSPVAFHHWDLEMGKYLLQDTLEDVFSKDRQLAYLHIAV